MTGQCDKHSPQTVHLSVWNLLKKSIVTGSTITEYFEFGVYISYLQTYIDLVENCEKWDQNGLKEAGILPV